MAIGLTPFMALAVPRSIAPDIERGGQAFLAGAIGGALQLVAGVTGPILDIFYVRTGMTRQVNVSTKAAAQVMGHLTKVTYFGALVANPGRPRPRAMAGHGLCRVFAVIGTTLSRSVLDRLSDKQFYYWTRRVILAIGAVYIAQGALADGGAMSDHDEAERQGPGAGAARPAARRLHLRRHPARDRRADVAQAATTAAWSRPSASTPDEVKRRLREWLKSERDK